MTTSVWFYYYYYYYYYHQSETISFITSGVSSGKKQIFLFQSLQAGFDHCHRRKFCHRWKMMIFFFQKRLLQDDFWHNTLVRFTAVPGHEVPFTRWILGHKYGGKNEIILVQHLPVKISICRKNWHKVQTHCKRIKETRVLRVVFYD